MKKYLGLILLLFLCATKETLAVSKIIESASITTNINAFYPTLDTLIQIEDDYKLVHFFVRFSRPIVTSDNIIFRWKFNEEIVSEVQIETKKNIWWYGTLPTLGKWEAVIQQNDKILVSRIFFYVNKLNRKEIIHKYTFKELLALDKNRRCGDALARLRKPRETKYDEYLRIWWRKKCLAENQYKE
ncbi:MAG: hypothetical protein ACRENO_01220 [Thermodesulfobacteriota bacterium]